MLDHMVQTVKDFAALIVKNLGFVTKWRGNVMVDVKMDGLKWNVTQVWLFLRILKFSIYSLYVMDSWKQVKDNTFY